MEGFPTWLTALFTSILATECAAGIFLNMYYGLKQTPIKKAKGNKFTPLLMLANTFTGLITIPLLIASLFVSVNDSSTRWLCMASEATVATTLVSTMAIITCTNLDRYNTIAQSKTNLFTDKRTVVIRCIVSVVSIIGFLLPVLSMSIQDKTSLKVSGRCKHRGPILYEFYVLLFYIAIFVTTTMTYVQIMKESSRFITPNDASGDEERRVSQLKKARTMRVSITFICSVTLLWLPFVVTYVTGAFMCDSQPLDVAYMIFMIIGLSTVIWNPLLNAILQGRVGQEQQRRRTTVVPMKVILTSNSTNVCLNSAFSVLSASTGAHVDRRYLPKISE